MIGDMISPTNELTIAPKAAPMMTPMARSTAFQKEFARIFAMRRAR